MCREAGACCVRGRRWWLPSTRGGAMGGPVGVVTDGRERNWKREIHYEYFERERLRKDAGLLKTRRPWRSHQRTSNTPPPFPWSALNTFSNRPLNLPSDANLSSSTLTAQHARINSPTMERYVAHPPPAGMCHVLTPIFFSLCGVEDTRRSRKLVRSIRPLQPCLACLYLRR
jgi:hypothetical protein